MRAYLLVLPILGACVVSEDPANYIDVEWGASEIHIVGDQIDNLYVDAKVTGPMRDCSPFTITEPTVQSADWTIIDNLQLTTGDQVWHPDGGWTYMHDTRSTAPDSLLAECGHVVQIQLALGAEMDDDGHVESSTGVVEAVVDCNNYDY